MTVGIPGVWLSSAVSGIMKVNGRAVRDGCMRMRDRIKDALNRAAKDRDRKRLSTLRLISAAIKDREIAARTDAKASGVSDDEILGILSKMVRQRNESAATYEEAGRPELAEQERTEISIIEEFLPQPLTEAEFDEAVRSAVASVGAQSIRDMGRVMGLLKSRHSGTMDFGKAGAAVKKLLG